MVLFSLVMAHFLHSRRNFLQSSIFGIGALSLLPNSALGQAFHLANLDENENDISIRTFQGNSQDDYWGAIPVVQGHTTATESFFTFLVLQDREYSYRILNPLGHELPHRKTISETKKFSEWGIEKIHVQGLNLNQIYTLQIIDAADGRILDSRIFQALNIFSKKARFAVASCMRDRYTSLRKEMWLSVAAANPDLIILNGDTCYADENSDGTLSGFWRRYCETRLTLAHFRLKKLIPTIATWDDHDFAQNNGDNSFKLKDDIKMIFQLFWDHQVPSHFQKGPGVSQSFQFCGQNFFLMDSRYFRSPRNTKINPKQWGDAQEDFLFQNLHKKSNPTWIINGSQFFGGYLKKDSFEYWQPENLKTICQRLSQLSSPVAFISGDVHFSEISKLEPEILGYESFEFTSSSIHSANPSSASKFNPRRLDSTLDHNFLLFESQFDQFQSQLRWEIDCKSLGLKSTEQFHRSLQIQR